jgi:hypothetical protein
MLPNGVTAFILPKKLRLPTNDAWNLSIQHQLRDDLAVEAAYIGNKGTHVFAGFGGDYDFNQATIEGFGTLTTNQRKPYFQKFGWSQNFRYYGSDADSNYHGMQLKAEKRFSRGYSLMSHYTWSRAFNYTNTYYNIDRELAYGPNDNHRRHVFSLSGLWELPFGNGRAYLHDAGGVLDALVGGWQVNTVFTWQSGLPFTPSYRDCNADRDTGWCRPGLVRDHAARSGWARHTAHHQWTDAGALAPARARHLRHRGTQPAGWSIVLPMGRIVLQGSRRNRRSPRAVPRGSLQLPEHGQSRESQRVRGLSGHRRTDHQHLPARDDASVAVRLADGILSGGDAMAIEDLVTLTNGLTVTACGHTLVCDRARITPVRNDAIEMKFLMAGTDVVPRLRLLRERVLAATPDEVTKILRRVVKSAIACR